MANRNMISNKEEVSPEQREELFTTLKSPFENKMNCHMGLEWAKVQANSDLLIESI